MLNFNYLLLLQHITHKYKILKKNQNKKNKVLGQEVKKGSKKLNKRVLEQKGPPKKFRVKRKRVKGPK